MSGSDETSRPRTRSPALDGFLASLIVLVVIGALIATQMSFPSHRRPASAARPSSGKGEPLDAAPKVQPVILRTLSPDAARAFNQSIPFSAQRNAPARPFRFAGADEDRSRATACLAAAVLYEAGDDAVGQRAVAQVVLNRVRHPAFPRTICGVVFQGSERRTGCQFTFTCDGALNRSFSDDAWVRARRIAEDAISGAVFKPVGEATHYHTDWVVPYWSSSLDKIFAVHSHLFFRWKGWWGTPPAFRFNATGDEPRVSQLAYRFPEHVVLGVQELTPLDGQAQNSLGSSFRNFVLKSNPGDPNTYSVFLPSKFWPHFQEIAEASCGDKPFCRVLIWTDPKMVPKNKLAQLMPKNLAALSFSYVRDESSGWQRALWNCAEFSVADSNCLRPKVSYEQDTLRDEMAPVS